MNQRHSFLFLLARLQTELNRLFEEFEGVAQLAAQDGGWSPSVDVFESDEAVVVLAEVPGLDEGAIKAEATGNVLTVSGVKKTPAPGGKGQRFHCIERAQGSFERRIQLPRVVNSARAEASLAGGILRISFPKVKDQRQRQHRLTIQFENDDVQA